MVKWMVVRWIGENERQRDTVNEILFFLSPLFVYESSRECEFGSFVLSL